MSTGPWAAAPPQGMFTLAQREREARLLPQLLELTAHHRACSPGYARILAALGVPPDLAAGRVADLPWLPARLFKEHDLRSIPDDAVFRVVTSSATTGQPSRVALDRAAAARSQHTLARTLRAVAGPVRLPMLIADSRAVLARQPSLAVRGATVLGMMVYGRDHAFVLDEEGQPAPAAVRAFLRRHGQRPFLLFGFTFMVWQHLLPMALAESLDLSHGLLLHTGGWKRLAAQQVSNAGFRRRLSETGLRRVHNFYAMAEQVGVVFLEGDRPGELYCPDVADVIVREPGSWAEAPPGVPGVVQVASVLPTSYPGHLLLTEDLGVVHGTDDGQWPGKRFSVLGRLPRAEARGCSDTGDPAA